MYINDMPLNYVGVIAAAIIYFIWGWIWYMPALFGHRCIKHDDGTTTTISGTTTTTTTTAHECPISHTIGAFLGEFILDLIMAFVLAVFIQISQAQNYIEAITIALWVWIGFIATTHFSAVLWGRKSLKSFFIHACFMLIGLIAMSVVIFYFI